MTSTAKGFLEKSLPLGTQRACSGSSLNPVDRSAERKLLWKIDLHLVPILFLLL